MRSKFFKTLSLGIASILSFATISICSDTKAFAALNPTQENVIKIARQQIGKPYVWGAKGPNSFDCSGLVQYVYQQVGLSVPAPTYNQINCGTAVSQSNLQPGDLVFPSDGHVQIYSGNGYVIEAPEPGKNVREVKMWGFYKARRILNGSGSVNSKDVKYMVTMNDGTSLPWVLNTQDNAGLPGDNRGRWIKNLSVSSETPIRVDYHAIGGSWKAGSYQKNQTVNIPNSNAIALHSNGNYYIHYRVYLKDTGWLPWVREGSTPNPSVSENNSINAGIVTSNKPIQAIEMYLSAN